MRDLSDFKGCPAPQPVTLKGRYVTAEPFDRDRHLARLWTALGGEGVNALLKYFPQSGLPTLQPLVTGLSTRVRNSTG